MWWAREGPLPSRAARTDTVCPRAVWRDGTELTPEDAETTLPGASAGNRCREQDRLCSSRAASRRRRAARVGRTSTDGRLSFRPSRPLLPDGADQGRLLDSPAMDPNDARTHPRGGARSRPRLIARPPRARSSRPRSPASSGRKAPFAEVQRSLGSLDPEDRRVVGRLTNEVRDALQAAVEERRAALEGADETRLLEADADRRHAAGPRGPAPGSLHPLTLVENRDRRRLHADGVPGGRGPRDRGRLAQLRGPQHPAGPSRAHDEGLALRRRPGARPAAADRDVSAMQIRTMESQEPPVYIVSPGAHLPPGHARTRRTSRSSTRSRASRSTRASRSPTCKGTLEAFARELFGARPRCA